MATLYTSWVLLMFMIFIQCIPPSTQISHQSSMGNIRLNSKISVKGRQVWMSENGTFAFGFSQVSRDHYVLGIWYANIPGNRTLVWMANSQGEMQESGNFVLYNSNRNIVWQSFASPTDTLLPEQQLTETLNLTSWNSSTDVSTGHYSLKMVRTPVSLKLALNYNAPSGSSNYSYWSGPEIFEGSDTVVVSLDHSGSISMSYSNSSNGLLYIYQNSNRLGENERILSRITIEHDGNVRLYRWDANNGSRWIVDWAAVSRPCTTAGICGNGICKLDSKSKPQCHCPTGSYQLDSTRPSLGCLPSRPTPDCRSDNNASPPYKIMTLSQTKYYGGSSIIANYSNISSMSGCGDICLSDCSCVASVYGISNHKPLCWTLKSLLFGGFQDLSYTFFVKVSLDNGTLGNHRAPASSAPSSNREKEKSRLKMIVLGTVLGTAFVLCLFCLFFSHNIFTRKRRGTLDASIFIPGTPAKFSFVDLQTATNNFRQRLGTGGFGTVYKGSLSDGTLIAVKKLERLLPHGEREFKAEVTTIGAIHHMNLVHLCGFCSEGLHRLLVYEFLPNGSLDRWLFHSNANHVPKLLDWETRYNITLGTAQGIAYFHEQCRDTIIHCDIKPENILLDEDFCSKVSDFGLAKMMGREHSHVITMVRGTRGYLAPEWVTNRPITVKADVYSYGMVILEIIGGRRNLDISLGAEKFFFPGWAFQEMMKGNISKVADKRLCGEFNESQLIRALRVAFWCIQDDVAIRPYMGSVIKMLEGTIEVNVPPMPQSVLEMMEEGLPNIYNNMKRDLTFNDSSTTTNGNSIRSSKRVQSDAAFDYSSISIPR
ncbi:hypothetical protein KI387_037505 [Taxus chinensis]|uniref:Receptor-like serine/threonine-protein kinase n=1 Tax=Taxus chinensis TaxID=29808 RepID=A0AA38FSM2_TAXCH|nr:hypothetical protein KI387_037505 [Taxus chinensis]